MLSTFARLCTSTSTLTLFRRTRFSTLEIGLNTLSPIWRNYLSIFDAMAKRPKVKLGSRSKATWTRGTPAVLTEMLDLSKQQDAEDHIPDFSSLSEDNPQDLAKLRSWAMNFIEKKLALCGSFRTRSAIRQIKRDHREKLDELKDSIDRARAAYAAAGERYEHFEQLLSAIDRLKKKKSGILKSMGENPNATEQKNKKAKELLEQTEAELGSAIEELNEYKVQVPEYDELQRAKTELQTFKDLVGITQLERSLDDQLASQGNDSFKTGFGFESSSLPIAQDLISSLVTEEAMTQDVIASADETSFSAGNSMIHILSGITLGCSNAEFDYMIVREPILPDREPVGQLLFQIRNAKKQTKIDLINKLATVEVLAILECKRNLNDVGRSFAHFQQTLSWFKNERELYDPSIFRTKFYTTGHFDKVHVHIGDSIAFKFDQSSFDRFRRDPASGYYIDHLYFITAYKSSLSGMHAQQKCLLEFRLATDVELDIEGLHLNAESSTSELTPAETKYFRDLLLWLKEQLSNETSTKDVFNLFATKEEWAKQIIFLQPNRE
eukprot:TRINITY_DN11625_c0_g1_i1.p1 TRINITY_DN11625_c0_g1~~TRINITY_DN11625_c0_g1_i1.p1  ORF type:complete len:552 (-),score=136.91 TRINITY_DN11625_c0_g1_i1:24-1679(-)